ncbi:MAG: hypothetical protein M3494_07345 [Actinomycetota bacterium]|jgi:hypothetical protein|nr:hypothetical protein [Rubrobacter sp.]MDQ3507812.1 hypothetical protein [Actinomycetota bacterium]
MAELHLRVFADRSELVRPDGEVEVFDEGPTNAEARERYQRIKARLSDGYLDAQITLCKEHPGRISLQRLDGEHTNLLDELVSSMGSEVGRALIGLMVLQLCVKSIEPAQSIRLHKGGPSESNFSWRDGISMRSLDKNHITPVLRGHELLRLNADGFMMTRSLAENYPYSTVYKARIRGARSQWAAIVECVERGEIEPEPALHYLLSQLVNAAGDFRTLADSTLSILDGIEADGANLDRESILEVMEKHILASDYRARIMEISMHSLMQAVEESDALGGETLEPLSQMRSANKKHGNIGDIEILAGAGIVESWDAKYGKHYLRDELEELDEKLDRHPGVRLAGFVTDGEPEHLEELDERRLEIEDTHGTSIRMLGLKEWVGMQFDRTAGIVDESELASRWISAYAESLSLRRLDRAPIDEPCHQWLATLHPILENLRDDNRKETQ